MDIEEIENIKDHRPIGHGPFFRRRSMGPLPSSCHFCLLNLPPSCFPFKGAICLTEWCRHTLLNKTFLPCTWRERERQKWYSQFWFGNKIVNFRALLGELCFLSNFHCCLCSLLVCRWHKKRKRLTLNIAIFLSSLPASNAWVVKTFTPRYFHSDESWRVLRKSRKVLRLTPMTQHSRS